MEAHEALFKLLVTSWRKNWNNEAMPFYFVQLSSLNRASWPCFRDSQRRLMAVIPHSGMAVSSDCGDSLDVHPRDKRPIGERLARWALAKTYAREVSPSGPLFRRAVLGEGKGCVVVSFDYSEGLSSSDYDKVIGFELAEFEDVYYPAEAEIKGGCVYLYSSGVKNPKFVRYGWQPFTRANLINGEGLPASTFKSGIDNITILGYPVGKGISAGMNNDLAE